MDLTLPFDYATIERILPHRYPFLLVDRITELEVDKRVVGPVTTRSRAHMSCAPTAAPDRTSSTFW